MPKAPRVFIDSALPQAVGAAAMAVTQFDRQAARALLDLPDEAFGRRP
jgi:hypothetical protein